MPDVALQDLAVPVTGRSRNSSRSRPFMIGVDGRTVQARRFRDLIAAHTSELAHDPSEAEASIIRRASALEMQLEQLEAAWLSQAPATADLEAYSRLSNTLRRHLAAIGLGRTAPPTRRAAPTLSQYLPQPKGLAK